MKYGHFHLSLVTTTIIFLKEGIIRRRMAALEMRFSEPSQEFKVLKNLQKRIANDMAQRQIIINYLSDKHGDEQEKKRVKYTSL